MSYTPLPLPLLPKVPLLFWEPPIGRLYNQRQVVPFETLATAVGTPDAELDAGGQWVYNYAVGEYHNLPAQVAITDSHTMMIAVKFDAFSAANDQFFVGSYVSGSANSLLVCKIEVNGGAADYLEVQFGNSAVWSVTQTSAWAPVAGQWYIITVRHTSGDTDVDIWIDGVVQATTNPTANTGNATPSSQNFAIGLSGNVSVKQFDGKIGHCVVFGEALSDFNRALVEAGLKTLYGVA
jgi:hypothetical protein